MGPDGGAGAGEWRRGDEIDDYIQAEITKRHIPGVSLAVVKQGKVVKAKGYGLANVELNVSATPDTVYKIGSVSKQFLATGIMLLVQDGKLKVGDPIGSYLEGTPEAWKDITIRHLLTHTSGLPRKAPGFEDLKIQSDAELIKTAYSQKLGFAPGEKWRYCNLGYFALAEIIRKVSGKPWGEFMRERVFAPLDMKSTRVTTVRDIVPNRADGYYWRGHLENDEVMLAVRPAARSCRACWTWPSGTRRSKPTRSSRRPAGTKCGRRSRSTTARRTLTDTVGSSKRSGIAGRCATAVR